MSQDYSISNLLVDFIKKTNLNKDDDMTDYENGDIIEDNKNTFKIYSDELKNTITVFKQIEMNTIKVLKDLLRIYNIKPKGTLKKDICQQVLNVLKSKFKTDDESKEMDKDEFKELDDDEYSDRDELDFDCTIEQAEEAFNHIFIEWIKKDGDIVGRMKRKVIEFLINKKIKKRMSYYEQEGYPVRLFTRSKYHKHIMIFYKDGDDEEKNVKIEKLTYQEYMKIDV